MLATLHIANLATVASLEIDFGAGLNAITGETGAGKSVILGAVQTVLGERAEKTLIRHGADALEISALFHFPHADEAPFPEIERRLREAGAPPCEEGALLLRRVVTATSTRCYVNSAPVTVRAIKELGDLLVDIHGPHDHQSLLNGRCQLDLLDAFAGHAAQVRHCRAVWTALRDAEAKLAEAAEETLSPAECDLLRHQVVEIERADLSVEEETELLERHRLASHAKRLVELAGGVANVLTEADGSVADALARPARQLQELAEIAPQPGDDFLSRLEAAIESLHEVSRELVDFAESLDLDPEEFARLEDRLRQIHDLKRKYRGDIEAILAKAESLRERLAAVDNREALVQAARDAVDHARATHAQCCDELAVGRRAAAETLAAAIAEKLAALGFASGHFHIAVSSTQPGPDGSDGVDFLFAPNPGQELMPLRKIASSGEMSRVMLAVKTVLVAADPVPLLIFDEVDANVGGRIAGCVAAELAAVAARHQILCITHLPQIAAVAKTHFQVGKQVAHGTTKTTMRQLAPDDRIDELVRMMGSADSANARAHAREMLADGVGNSLA